VIYEPIKLMLTLPEFRGNFYPGQDYSKVTGKIVANNAVTVTLEGPGIGTKTTTPDVDGNFTIDTADFEEGVALLTITDSVNTITKKIRRLAPTGRTMSWEKRKAVYELACRYDFIILEDDPYGELRFAGENIPAIKSLDTEGRVIYSSTFSKLISSGFRTGFVSAPAPIIQKMVVCKQVSDVHSNIWAQVVSHRFMTTVDREAHFNKLREIYRKKCELMCSYIDNGFSKKITYVKPEGGLFIWCTLPDDCDMNAFCTRAVQEYKVAIVPGNSFSISESDVSHSFRLNYSTPTNEQIIEGMEKLAGMTKDILD
jgi:2-aminoadipate transaminase